MAIESPKHFIAWVMGGYSFSNCYDSTKTNKLIFFREFQLTASTPDNTFLSLD